MDTYRIYADGAYKRALGCLAIGIVIINQTTNQTYNYSYTIETIKKINSNLAELYAIFYAVKQLIKDGNPEKVEICSDCQPVIQQINGLVKVKNEDIAQMILQLEEITNSIGNIQYNWIPRRHNTPAHMLCNEAIKDKMLQYKVKRLKVTPVNEHIYKVLSSSGNKDYIVDLINVTCTCPFYKNHRTTYRGKCKHIIAAEIQRSKNNSIQ